MKSAKILALLLLVMLACTASAATAAYLVVVGQDYSQSPAYARPGDTVTIGVPLSSTSTSSEATKLNAYLIANDNYFELIKGEEHFSRFETSATKTAIFRFRVKENAYPAAYNFTVKVDYYDNAKPITDQQDLSFEVSDYYMLDVENVHTSVFTAKKGQAMTVGAGIRNLASSEANNVQVTLVPVTENARESFIYTSAINIELGKILSGESKPVVFGLQPAEKAEPGTYYFEVEATCQSCEATGKEGFSIEVVGDPDLMVSGVEYAIEGKSDKTLLQGDPFSLSVQLDNIGKGKAKAVKVEITTDDAFLGVKESYVGKIDEDDSGAAVFDLQAALGAETGTHPVGIKVLYLDELDQPRELTQSIDLYVYQRPPESPVPTLLLVAVILVILYFVLKLVFMQLQIMRAGLE